MSELFTLRRLVAAAAVAAAAWPAQLQAAPATSNARGAARILAPLTVQKLADLDFGAVTVTTAGTIVLDPVSGSVSTTGGVIAVTSAPHAAHFLGAAARNTVVNIRLPRQPVTLTRLAGTETMTLRNFTLDSPSRRAMASSTSFEFKVGGTVDIAASQPEGTYVGTFTVTVQYP